MNFVTDTQALLWHFIDSPKLSRKAKDIFNKCEKGECIIFIPSIVIAECLSIFDKKKVNFDFQTLFNKIRKSENYSIIPLGHEILLLMIETKEVSELHDKIIAATTKLLGLPLITKDTHLRSLKNISTVW